MKILKDILGLVPVAKAVLQVAQELVPGPRQKRCQLGTQRLRLHTARI